MKKKTRHPLNIGLPQRTIRIAGPMRRFTDAAAVQKNHEFMRHFKQARKMLSARPSHSIEPFLMVLAQAHHLHL